MKRKLLLITIITAFLCSCAKEKKESVEEIQDRLLKSYIHVVHEDTIKPTRLGYYLIKLKEGTGEIPKENEWIKWEQTQKTLDGTVVLTTEENVAKKTGLYNYDIQTTHYIPNFGYNGKGYLFLCLFDVLKDMRVGSKYRIITPPRLLGFFENDKSAGYNSYILDIELKEIIKDPFKYEQNKVTEYIDKYYKGLDSAKNGFYFKMTYIAPDTVKDPIADTIIKIKDTTSVKIGKNVSVTYVGRFLDGFVFDTNIADTAKAHNIFFPNRKYNSYTFQIGDRTFIPGFEFALTKMKSGDKAIAIFNSNWGFSINGFNPNVQNNQGGNKPPNVGNNKPLISTPIQPYSPLIYEINLIGINK